MDVPEMGPFESAARVALGPRPHGTTESTYLLAVREFVDMMDTRTKQFDQEIQRFADEQKSKGGRR